MKRRSESQRTTDDADCAENVRTARGACLLLCIVVENHSNNYGNRGWKPLKQLCNRGWKPFKQLCNRGWKPLQQLCNRGWKPF